MSNYLIIDTRFNCQRIIKAKTVVDAIFTYCGNDKINVYFIKDKLIVKKLKI